ncbi:hypothetical protein QYF36_000172 [Acer negundo]|nr:hypothetical protein QYF36_000172 [Acer negundo]
MQWAGKEYHPFAKQLKHVNGKNGCVFGPPGPPCRLWTRPSLLVRICTLRRATDLSSRKLIPRAVYSSKETKIERCNALECTVTENVLLREGEYELFHGSHLRHLFDAVIQ